MATWTREIIADLIEQASWTARAKLLERLGTRFAAGALEEAEWHAVTDAFRIALFLSPFGMNVVVRQSWR